MIFVFLVTNKKMAQEEVDFYIRKYYNDLHESYSQEICLLRIKGTRLLQRIKLHEIKMNQRKQQKLKPHLHSVNYMNGMIRKLVKISAFIETYRYFQITRRSLVNQESLFHEIANDYYDDLLQNIILKIKRINQLNKSVDFTIN